MRTPEQEDELRELIAEQDAELRRKDDSRGERSRRQRSVGQNRSVSIDFEFDKGGSFHDLLDDGTDGVEVADSAVTVVEGLTSGNRGRRSWSQALIVEAIRKWVELYGEPPGCADWNPAQARSRGTPNRALRYASGAWPATATVVRHFGKWSAAIEAAGFRPLEPGPIDPSLSTSKRLSRRRLSQLRSMNGKTNGDVARTGPKHLRDAVEAVAKTDEADEDGLREALLRVAAVAVAWSDRIGR